MTDRPILIGCPPSSGSTLFSVMLDAHPEVFCGPELGLLAHPLVFREPFSAYRNQALRYLRRKSFSLPRRCVPWVGRLRAGLNPYLKLHHNNLESYGLDRKALRFLLRRSKSLDDLLGGIFERPLADSGKSVWAEKSPPNLYSFGEFLRRFPDGRVVYLVRDPRDSICSLMRRKFSFKRAVAVWLLETALCDRFADHPRAMRVRYEDLVTETAATMTRVLDFLGLRPALAAVLGYRDHSKRLDADRKISLRSWLLSPTEGVSRSSMGRWRESLSPVQRIALTAARIRRRGRSLDLPVGLSVGDLMRRLGYESEPLLPVRSIHMFSYLQEQRFLPTEKYPRRSRVFHERLVGCAVDRLPSWPSRRPVWADSGPRGGGAPAVPVHHAT